MKTVSKFIINRNELEYYYTEKCILNGEVFYHVHYNKEEKEKFNQDSFHAIFGTDEKLSIQSFINKIMYTEINDFDLDIYDKKCEVLNSINRKLIKSKNRRNPNLNVLELLYGLDICNKTLGLPLEIDHTDAYNLVVEKKSLESVPVMGREMFIKPLHLNEENLNLEKGIERIKKYDN